MLSNIGERQAAKWEVTTDITTLLVRDDLVFSPDGDQLVFCTHGKRSPAHINVVNISDGKEVLKFDVAGSRFRFAITPDGRHILVGGDFNAVYVYDTSTGEKVFTHDAFEDKIEYLYVTDDGTTMIAVDAASNIGRYPILGGVGWTPKVSPSGKPLRSFATSTDGRKICFLMADRRFYELNWPAPDSIEPRILNYANRMDGSHLVGFGTRTLIGVSTQMATVGRPGTAPGQFQVVGIPVHVPYHQHVRITKDDRQITLASPTGNVHIVDTHVPANQTVSQLPFQTPRFTKAIVRISPDGNSVAVALGSRIRIWRLQNDPSVRLAKVHSVIQQLLDSERYTDLSELTAFVATSDRSAVTLAEWSTLLEPGSVPFDYQTRLQQLRTWYEVDQKSLFPRWILSKQEKAVAWQARGTGYASSVSEKQFALFAEHIKAAVDYMDGYVPDKHTPPGYFTTRINLHVSSNATRDEFRKTTDALLKYHPRYLQAHRAAINYLMPRWHGEPGDCAFYASQVAQAIGRPDGEEFYVQLAEQQLAYYPDEEYFVVTAFDYDRIVRHLKKQMQTGRTAEAKDTAISGLLRFARRHGDKDTAKLAYEKFKSGKWSERNRQNQKVFRDCLRTERWLIMEKVVGGITVTPDGKVIGTVPPLPGRKKPPFQPSLPRSEKPPAPGEQ